MRGRPERGWLTNPHCVTSRKPVAVSPPEPLLRRQPALLLRAATTCGDDVSKKDEWRVSVISRALPHHQPMKTDPEGTEKISCVRQQYQLRPQRISMYLARYQTSPSVRPVSGESFTSSASIGYPPHSATNVRRPGKCYENNAPAINCKWM